MMLMNDRLKVTLQTIHIPLNKVTKEISKNTIIEKIKIINSDMKSKFGIKRPRILICAGLTHTQVKMACLVKKK